MWSSWRGLYDSILGIQWFNTSSSCMQAPQVTLCLQGHIITTFDFAPFCANLSLFVQYVKDLLHFSFSTWTTSFSLVILMYIYLSTTLSLSFRPSLTWLTLAALKYFLGWEIYNSVSDLCITLSKYAPNLPVCFGLIDAKSCLTLSALKVPSSTTFVLCSSANVQLYRQIAGALEYLTFSLAGIYFAVNKVYQQMLNWISVDLMTVRWIHRYVKGTIT